MSNIITDIVAEINSIDKKYQTQIALSQKETAKILGVSQSTLELWRRSGLGP